MSEAVVGRKRRRKPLTAVVLSLIMPGLGHVYCGRIAKGIVLAFLSCIFIPAIFSPLYVSHMTVRIAVVITTLLGSLAVWLIAIIDSWLTARHTTDSYTLKDYNRWYVYVILILMSTGSSPLLALNVRTHLIEAFIVPKASCYPTIVPGDRILANKIAYRADEPQRGDVVVFIYPENRRFNYIKRVVAIAGDTVQMKNNSLYVNGQELERTSMGRATLQQKKIKIEGEVFLEKNGEAKYRIFLADTDNDEKQKNADFAQLTVPEHHCFVVGDNRSNSRDSRHFGPVNLGLIKGRADYLYWPAGSWTRFGSIK